MGRRASQAMPLAVRLVLGLCAAWCLVYELRSVGVTTLPVGDARTVHLVVMGAGAALCLVRAACRREERLAWGLIGLAFASWVAGEVYFTVVLWDASQPPVPSWADAGYLGLPPLLFGGLLLLLRARVRGLPRMLWVDGITAALSAGAVSAAIVVQAVLGGVGGDRLAIATNLAYPLADLVLLGVIVGGLAAAGWRIDRAFGLIVAAALSFCLADSIYLVLVARGTWVSGGPVDMGWWVASLLVAAAAWQPTRVRVKEPAPPAAGRQVIAVPITFALLALGVLVAGSIWHLNMVAIVLATASLAAVMTRLALTFQEHREMLRVSRLEALTDPLTGLENRRQLVSDLDAALGDRRHRLLLLLDLNGFKAYNDSFGHAAGDQLLMRLGASLAAAVAPRGRAYRLGGDEFCVLLEADAASEELRDRALAALSEETPGHAISAAYGSVRLPDEAASTSAALKLADERMYACKSGSPASAAIRQVRDVLLGVLDERGPVDPERAARTAWQAHQIGLRLDLDAEQLDTLVRAAELHDVGLTAVPDAILSQPGPLSDGEWAFVRAHPLVSERILRRAPALRPVATLVRAVHERVDGSGYPDRLTGEEIPLGARIIAVCDAFQAMTGDRPHQLARTVADALAELRVGAGTQFDAGIVAVFCSMVEELGPDQGGQSASAALSPG